jgi:hypothetical protein
LGVATSFDKRFELIKTRTTGLDPSASSNAAAVLQIEILSKGFDEKYETDWKHLK